MSAMPAVKMTANPKMIRILTARKSLMDVFMATSFLVKCVPIFRNFRFPGPLEEFLDPGPEFSAKDKEACDEQHIAEYQEVDQSGVAIFFHISEKECDFCQKIGYNGGHYQYRDADSVPNLPHRLEMCLALFLKMEAFIFDLRS